LRTYFTTAADLAARCHRAAIEGRWATTMRFYAGPTLLVIDELGYLPLPAEAASALFQVVSQRYLKTSIVITTNRGVGAWGDILGDTTVAAAMLDRLLHRSIVINLDGESYRLRDPTTPPPKPCAAPPPAPANRYADNRSQVRNCSEHTWGISMSAINQAFLDLGASPPAGSETFTIRRDTRIGCKLNRNAGGRKTCVGFMESLIGSESATTIFPFCPPWGSSWNTGALIVAISS
jgi:hypothetical protein